MVSHSYGVIAIKKTKNNGQLKVLMIQRKDSVGFIECIKSPKNISKTILSRLVDQMTNHEKAMIQHASFEECWQRIWSSSHINQKKSCVKFTSLHEALAFHAKDRRKRQNLQTRAKGKLFRRFQRLRRSGEFHSLCTSSKTSWVCPSWGFPKGRLDKTDISLHLCAVREWREETGLVNTKLSFLCDNDLIPIRFVEDYKGTNNIRYILEYFVALVPMSTSGKLNPHNSRQLQEVHGLEWLTFEHARVRIRSTHSDKLAVLRGIEKLLPHI